jgi:KDO2-lipid IV(A) lauroyltransferase
MLFIVEYIILVLLKASTWLLNLIPIKARIKFVEYIIRFIVLFFPKYKKVSFINLKHVFPQKNATELNIIYQKSFNHLARLIVDTVRLPTLSAEWIKNNVEIDIGLFQSLKNIKPTRPVLYATGHLGSFSLMAHAVAEYGFPLNFIVRNFSLPQINNWWCSLLELNGNQVIPRKGAVSVMLKKLAEGQDCGVLFDQNVKRNYAIFIDVFGRPAATTFAVGLAAIRTECLIVVASMYYDETSGKYKVVTDLCECDEIYQDKTLSQDQKILQITLKSSKLFEKHILAFPQGWFWMHQRWKTAIEGQPETFYKS